mgnify:CR=1 FL=1
MTWELVLSIAAMLWIVLSLLGAGGFSRMFRWSGLAMALGLAAYGVIMEIAGRQPINAGLFVPVALIGALGWVNLLKWGQSIPRRTKEGKFAPRPPA